MWTTAAAYQDNTAPHRRQAWATSVQSRGQTNTAVEHMQSWKGCICMVQIPLGGKYTWAFKEKKKQTHTRGPFEVQSIFVLLGLSSMLIFRFEASSPGFNQELMSQPLKFTGPFFLCCCFHMFMDSLNVTQHRIRNLFPPFMWLWAMERTEWMNNTHTCMHRNSEEMGIGHILQHIFWLKFLIRTLWVPHSYELELCMLVYLHCLDRKTNHVFEAG